MKAILLDGSHAGDSTGARVRGTLAKELQYRGWEVEHVALCEKSIGHCAGQFLCWIKHPGTCMLDDDNRTIAAAMATSDLLVYLTPITFGGYSSVLKRMVDHQIQNISPYFTSLQGETHHRERYPHNPDFLAIGWLDTPDPQAEAIFRHLVRRNALNFYAEHPVSGVVHSGQSEAELETATQHWLDDLEQGRATPADALPAPAARPVEPPAAGSSLQHALLLVGSPRKAKSTSNALGQYLLRQLGAEADLERATIYLHTALSSADQTQDMLESVERADVVILTFPLYVDSLPAPAIEALEQIAAHRSPVSNRPLFVAIANSGFPEASQNLTALAICEDFAGQAGVVWAGGLALGGGGMLQPKPLEEQGGRSLTVRKALDLAAGALRGGESIPETAQALLTKQSPPSWLYRLIANLSWKQAAKKYGAQELLKQRPYAQETR